MRRLILPPLCPPDLLCRHDPFPDGAPVHVATVQHGVGALGSLQGGVLAVLADQDGGGAVDVEVGGHKWRRTSSTALTAAEAVMSGCALSTARTASLVWVK